MLFGSVSPDLVLNKKQGIFRGPPPPSEDTDSQVSSQASYEYESGNSSSCEGRKGRRPPLVMMTKCSLALTVILVSAVAYFFSLKVLPCSLQEVQKLGRELISPLDDRLPLMVALGQNNEHFDYNHHLQSTAVLNDIQSVQAHGQIPVKVKPEEIATFLNQWAENRNQGLALSPDGGRLAVTSFSGNQIALITFSMKQDETSVMTQDVSAISPEGLAQPHGLAFLDDWTLVVSNRVGSLILVDLDRNTGTKCLGSRPVVGKPKIMKEITTWQFVRSLGLWLRLLCNNFLHNVNRYILDGSNDWNVVVGETLLREDISVPDGMAITASGEYVAVINHFLHAVYIYQVSEYLGPDSEPVGKLFGVHYPHGLEFVENDRKLLATDAGSPFICSWTAPSGDGSGDRMYTERYRVKNDATFFNAHVNHWEEGGPKGLAVIRDDIVVVTSNFQPLLFFNLGQLSKVKNDSCPNHDWFNAPEVYMKRLAREKEDTKKKIKVINFPARGIIAKTRR